MKYLFALVVLIPSICFSQKIGDSKIIVSVTDTANLFNRLSLVFYEHGYTFDTKDESVGFIKTKETQMKDYSPYLTVMAFVKSNTITFSSKIRLDGIGVFDLEFEKRRKNAFTAAWVEVEDIAKLFGVVSYSR